MRSASFLVVIQHNYYYIEKNSLSVCYISEIAKFSHFRAYLKTRLE